MSDTSRNSEFSVKTGFESAILKASAMPPISAAAYIWGLKMSETSKMVNFQSKLDLKVRF